MKHKPTWQLQAAIILFLALALLPLPYGYYILLRIACCSAFVYLGIRALDYSRNKFAYILFGVAVIYNPVFRIHLNRDIWSAINIATIIIAFISMAVVRMKPE